MRFVVTFFLFCGIAVAQRPQPQAYVAVDPDTTTGVGFVGSAPRYNYANGRSWNCKQTSGTHCTWTQTSGAGGGATIQSTILLVKGDNAGNGIAATPGVDYVIPAGNVATATALANPPTPCGANLYAFSIAANGNLGCAQVAYSQVSGTPALFSDPGGNGFVIRSALNTSVARSILGTAAHISVSNNDGTAGNPVIDLIATAVTPGTYGTATNVPQITFDVDGRATAAANVAIAACAVGGSSGDLQKNNGASGCSAANINQNADGSLNASKAVTVPTGSAPTYAAAGTTTCDLSVSNVCAPSAIQTSGTTLALTNPHGGGPYWIIWTQSAVPITNPITYPGSMANCPQPTATLNKHTIFQFVYDGAANYYCEGTDDTATVIVGPERSAVTTTAASEGALTFDSASHTGTYFANNSVTRHAFPRVASGDQMAVSDLSDGPTVAVKASIQSGVYRYCRSTTGNATYTCTLTPTLTAYTRGGCLQLDADTANTTTATVNVDSLGAQSILDRAGSALAAGAVTANKPIAVCYDGAEFIIQGDGGGSVATAFSAGRGSWWPFGAAYSSGTSAVPTVANTLWCWEITPQISMNLGKFGGFQIADDSGKHFAFAIYTALGSGALQATSSTVTSAAGGNASFNPTVSTTLVGGTTYDWCISSDSAGVITITQLFSNAVARLSANADASNPRFFSAATVSAWSGTTPNFPATLTGTRTAIATDPYLVMFAD